MLGKDLGYALTEAGEVWVWGANTDGELGVGDIKPRDKPFPLVLLDGFAVDTVCTGSGRTFCVTSGEYHKKIFERECCQGQYTNCHRKDRLKVLADRNK